MKRGHVYTFVFMVVVTAVLVFALALAYEAFKPSIQTNKALQEQRAVLYALGLDDGLTDDEVRARYQEKVQFGGLEFEDPDFGYVPKTTPYKVPEEIMLKIISAIRENL